MKLVFIHGRSQEGKDPDHLREEWIKAFDEGLECSGLARPTEADIVLPFYGDELDELIQELEAPLLTDVSVAERGESQDEQESEFRGQFLQEIADAAGLSDEDILESSEGVVAERGPGNWRWVHGILRALDKKRGLGALALDRFTRDVYVYLTNPNVQSRIDAFIERHITGEPCVVVGHSLGSIIGYNVLRATRHTVARFVTVGSPLGVKAVKQLLKGTLGKPLTTNSWINARDPEDLVALYPLDIDNFPTNPPIVNINDVDNRTPNQHGIIGYLPDKRVAAAIREPLVG